MRTRCNFKTPASAALAFVALLAFAPDAFADTLRLVDGSSMVVDEAWEDAQSVWYRRGGGTRRVERAGVKKIGKDAPAAETAKASSDVADVVQAADGPQAEEAQAVLIHLVGGAK